MIVRKKPDKLKPFIDFIKEVGKILKVEETSSGAYYIQGTKGSTTLLKNDLVDSQKKPFKDDYYD